MLLGIMTGASVPRSSLRLLLYFMAGTSVVDADGLPVVLCRLMMLS